MNKETAKQYAREMGLFLVEEGLAQGMTKTGISEVAGVALANFSHWKHGRATPSATVLIRLAEATGCRLCFVPVLEDENDA